MAAQNARAVDGGRSIITRLITGMGVLSLAVASCGCKPGERRPPAAEAKSAVAPIVSAETSRPLASQKLPQLLDLGAHACVPCKMMAPVLEELKRDYAAVFRTEFVDVWQKPDVGRQYGVESIPTQIFFDADGRELFRHVGFLGKEDILAKWEELGVIVKGEGSEPLR